MGLHHFHTHYRLPDKNSPLLNNPRVQSMINKSVFALAVLNILVTIPQIMKIWIGREAEGVSLITWSGYAIGSTFWLLYGLLHKDKAIIFGSAGGVVVNSSIVVGVLLFS